MAEQEFSSEAIRLAVAADLDALEAIEREAFGNAAWSRAALGATLAAPTALALVAEVGGLVQASMSWQVVVDEAELLRVAVTLGSRRRGLARALLEASEPLLRARQVSRLHLEVRDDNHPAIGLYRRSGWATSGSRPGYYDGEVAAILMTRRLE